MIVAVSPYHLTTRETAALAALLLATRVVTLVPGPGAGAGAGPGEARREARRVRTFGEMVRSWEWSEPLWHAGVLAGEIHGDTAAADMRDVARLLALDERLADLRPFCRAELSDSEQASLGAVAADVLKGGPDPGISLPLSAGIDRFAVRHGVMVARAAPVSVAQRAEAELAWGSVPVAVPVFVQADAERLLIARDELQEPLSVLRAAFAGVVESEGGARVVAAAALQRAASGYADAFRRRRDLVFAGAADDEVRAVEGVAVVTAMMLPGDAVLRSSLAALRRVGPRRAARNAGPDPAVTTLPVPADPFAARSFQALVVRPLGR